MQGLLEGRWIEFAADPGIIESMLGEKDFNIHFAIILRYFFLVFLASRVQHGSRWLLVVGYLSLPIISCGFRPIFFGVVLCPIPLNASISESTLYW